MIGPFKRGIAYILLLLSVALPSVAVQAQQEGEGLVAVLQEARDAGVPEALLDRVLALGYEKQIDPAAMGRLLAILVRCQRENVPLQPFLSKIEEGVAKKAPPARIEQVLRNKLEDYRFTQSLIAKSAKGRGEAEPIAPEYLVRVAETLYCGVSRQDLDQLLSEFPLAPLPIVARCAELLASLKQIQFDPTLSEQIVDAGVNQGYLTTAQKDFSRIIMVAKQKGLADGLIAKAALEAIEKGESQTEFSARLGISSLDLEHLGSPLGAAWPVWVKPRDTGKGRGGAQAGPGIVMFKGPANAGDPASAGSGGDPTTETSSKRSEAEPAPKKKPVRFTAAGAVVDFRPESSTMTLEIEKANRVLKKRIGATVSFVLNDNVTVKGEGPEPGLLDLDLGDIKAGESHVRVLGKKLAGPIYVITHLVVSLDDEEQRAITDNSRFTAAGIATNLDPGDLTLTLGIEKAEGVLGGFIGDALTFNISQEVEISAEGPESSLFGLSLGDLPAEGGYLKVQGKELAGGDYLITRIVVLLDD